MTSLGTLNGGVGPSQANAVNNAGQVAGWTVTSTAPGNAHPFLWTPGEGMIELGQLPASEHGEANAINDRGDVVGFAGFHGFLYSQGEMTDLGTLGGYYGSSAAFGINNLGQVVGTTSLRAFNDSAFAAFIFSQGVMTDLNTLIPAGFYLDGALGINDAGRIAAQGSTAQDIYYHHAFLLTPVVASRFAVVGFPSATTAGVAGGFTVTATTAAGATRRQRVSCLPPSTIIQSLRVDHAIRRNRKTSLPGPQHAPTSSVRIRPGKRRLCQPRSRGRHHLHT